jgi:protein-S-isoprenylcysteine O-methyltransferase Ste14
MDSGLFRLVFYIGLLIMWWIRWPHERLRKTTPVASHRRNELEAVLLATATIGMLVVPLAACVPGMLSFADYEQPHWVGLAGVAMAALSLVLFRRAHSDLGRNWSPTLEIRDNHRLITDGIYAAVRHPMYTAIFGWTVGQLLLLQNWVSGPAGFMAFLPLYLLRVDREEAMMQAEFGDAYSFYRASTGRLLPKLWPQQETWNHK